MFGHFKQIYFTLLLISIPISQVYLFYEVKEDLMEIYGNHESSCNNENDCCSKEGDSCCDNGCTCISHPCSLNVALCYLPSFPFIQNIPQSEMNFNTYHSVYEFRFLNDIFHPPAFRI